MKALRLRRAAIIVLALLMLSGLQSTPWSTPEATADDQVPTVALGVYANPRPGESQTLALQSFEDRMGHRFAVTREFLRWNAAFPTSFHLGLRDSGHTLLVSVKPLLINGQQIPWADVASAPIGSSLYDETVAWAQRMRGYGVPLYFTFHHEPTDVPQGTAPQYIDAWRRVVNIFREQGATNVRFLWTMTAYSFEVASSNQRAAIKWYPGDVWVDALGADAYNFYHCRTGQNTPWRTLADLIEGFRRFGLAHPSKELWLPEWGSVEDGAQPGRRAAWITDATALFKQPAYGQFRGIAYFHNGGRGGDVVNCLWWLDTSQSDTDAFTAMAADVFYQATGVPPDTTPPDTAVDSGPSGTVRSDTAEFNFSSSEWNSTFECRLDDGSFTGCDSPVSYAGLADGNHTFEARATDPAGNTDPDPASRTFLVNTQIPTPLTITYRSAAASGSRYPRTAITIALPAGTQPGDVMVASIVSNADQPGFIAPAGWALVRQDTVADVLRQAIYLKVVGPSEPASFTWTVSTQRRLAGGITTYDGVDPAQPVDVHGALRNTIASNSVTAPSITTSVDGVFLVYLAALNAEGSIAAPAGMTERWEAAAPRAGSPRDATASASDAPQTSAGPTGTLSATTTQSGRSIAALLALRPGSE